MARRIWIICLSLALAGITLPASAQDGVLEDLYGRGVHAYFENRYEEAHELLTKAITSGLKDPRAHYFRGLSYIRLGRPDEAKADFNTGAELEAIADEPINIGRAIERVQGAERLAIERHRRAAKLTLFDKAERAAKARYEERVEAEKRVLLPKGRRPAGAAPADAPADETDPFREEAVKPAPLPATPNAKPANPPAAEGAPAATPDPKPTEPKPADPAADDAKPPVAAEAPRGSVFGALFRAVKSGIPGDAGAGAGAAPGAAPAAPGAAPAAPAARPAPGGDPFADPPAKPAEKPAAAPAASDPFAK